MVALACSMAGSACGQGDVPIPTFDGPYVFDAPFEARSLAATPPGFDLVGSGSNQSPDGFAEIAVAGELDGIVRIYRNQNLWDTLPGSSLTILQNINVFDLIDIDTNLDGTDRITQIHFADMNQDTFPDLLVSAVETIGFGNEIVQLGAFLVFPAIFDTFANTFVGFDAPVVVRPELPTTGFTVADYNKDGQPDIILACVDAFGDPPLDASRAVILKGVLVGGVLTLERQPDADYPAMFRASANVVSGEFSLITIGGIGGGGSGTTLDFVTFGGSSGDPADGPLVVGLGAGTGPFAFGVVSKGGTDCGSDIPGLAAGSEAVFSTGNAVNYPHPLVAFDPFASADQSLATSDSFESVRIIHNRPRTGAFYHMCNITGSADLYKLDNCEGTQPSLLAGSFQHLVGGNLNGDAYGDLVHLYPTEARGTFLLGRGTPDASNRILQHICGSDLYRLNNYAPVQGSGNVSLLDQAVCADLDNDGFDEIIISRAGVQVPGTIRVYRNSTGPQ